MVVGGGQRLVGKALAFLLLELQGSGVCLAVYFGFLCFRQPRASGRLTRAQRGVGHVFWLDI